MTWDPESWAITPAQLSMRISRPGGNWICNEGCSTQAAQMGGWVWEELSLEPQTQGPGHQLWRAAANCPGSPVNKVGKPWGGSPLPAKIKYKICREITRRAVMISLRDSGINYNINRMPPTPPEASTNSAGQARWANWVDITPPACGRSEPGLWVLSGPHSYLAQPNGPGDGSLIQVRLRGCSHRMREKLGGWAHLLVHSFIFCLGWGNIEGSEDSRVNTNSLPHRTIWSFGAKCTGYKFCLLYSGLGGALKTWCLYVPLLYTLIRWRGQNHGERDGGSRQISFSSLLLSEGNFSIQYLKILTSFKQWFNFCSINIIICWNSLWEYTEQNLTNGYSLVLKRVWGRFLKIQSEENHEDKKRGKWGRSKIIPKKWKARRHKD